jgi:VWFA-related protein
MRYHNTTFSRPLFIAFLFCMMSYAPPASAQEPVPKASPPAKEEVLRVETELVQTPVLVFDKQGRFVDNLKREQFELRIDGQPHPVTFFERVTAGTQKEIEQYEAARKGVAPQKKPSMIQAAYGRTLIFFVDDYHLTSESAQRTREALLKFIDNTMGQNDSAVITTATGQLGFLQQLTDNKDVLRIAAGKIKFRQPGALDTDSPPMSPYQAVILERGGDESTMRRFADYLMQTQYKGLLEQSQRAGVIGSPGSNAGQQEKMMESLRKQAENSVRQRARRILSQYSTLNQMTYRSLENLMRATIEMPGSKLVILISDGFHMTGQKTGEMQRLNSVTDAAVRSGAVIYSIQAGGLTTAMPDAKSDVRYTTRLGDSGLDTGLPPVGEDTSLQGPLYTLAVDTGGQPLFNSNSMGDSIKKAIRDTAEYYLLAWKPQTSAQRQPGFRKIQVTVSGRPELTVRMQRGFLDQSTSAAEASAKGAQPNTQANTPQAAVQKALSATFPITDLPTALSVSYMDLPQDGTKLITVTEVMSSVLFTDNPADKEPREIEVTGVVLDDDGKPAGSFNGRLPAQNEASADQARPQEKTVFQVARTQIKPGLYQIRVAAHEAKSGRTGSASQWLLVPDLSSKRLALGSILVGEKALENAKSGIKPDADQRARLSVNHHFSRNSRLRFMTHIYNASRGESGTEKPDLGVQMRIVRNNESVSTSPEMTVETVTVEDMDRIPYAAQINLGALAPGRYALIVSVTDRHEKTTATQSINFWVE